MIRSRAIAIVVSICLALVGVVGIVAYVNAAAERASAGEKLTKVWTLRETIPAGTSAADLTSLVAQVEVPARLQIGTGVRNLSELAGLVSEVSLIKGEILSADRFISQASFDRQVDRSVERPAGLQEITIGLEPERALGGLIVPGDTVGVFMSFDTIAPSTSETADERGAETARETESSPRAAATFQTLRKVLITNIQVEEVPEIAQRQGLGDEQDREVRLAPSGRLLITLAVDSEQAQELVFATNYGDIWLSNEPTDASDDSADTTTLGNIYEQ